MSFGLLHGLLLLPSVQADTLTTVTCDGTPSCVLDLRTVIDIDEMGVNRWFSEAAKTAVERMDTAHDEALKETGQGLYYGNWLPVTEERKDLTGQDCTTLVLEVLSQAFLAAGMAAEWDSIFKTALAASGPGGFKGIELFKALQEQLDWEGVYFNPDVGHPSDADDEHPYSAYIAEKKGTYYGLDIDRMVLDYRPSAGSVTVKDTQGLDWLKSIPFAVVAARGGKHMAILVEGDLYEVHWSENQYSRSVITQEGFVDWGWLSGAILFPPIVEPQNALGSLDGL